jgi:hypothetical protein
MGASPVMVRRLIGGSKFIYDLASDGWLALVYRRKLPSYPYKETLTTSDRRLAFVK